MVLGQRFECVHKFVSFRHVFYLPKVFISVKKVLLWVKFLAGRYESSHSFGLVAHCIKQPVALEVDKQPVVLEVESNDFAVYRLWKLF